MAIVNRNSWSSKQIVENREQRNVVKALIPSDSEQLYLLNLNTIGSSQIEMVSLKVIPNTVSEAYNQRIINESPYGTYSPIYTYSGGQGKQLSFSINLIEDEHGIRNSQGENSIYNLIDRIKRMSEPVVGTNDAGNFLKPPSVYFQLGNQFAGKGHITTTFDLNKPYRKGRFIYISLSVTFVFEDEYETFAYETNTSESYVVPTDLTFNISELFNETSITDFWNEYLSFYDIELTQDFATNKLSKLFNTSRMSGTYSQRGFEANLFGNNQRQLAFTNIADKLDDGGHGSVELSFKYDQEFAYQIMHRYLTDLTSIISGEFIAPNAKVKNLNLLRDKIAADHAAFLSRILSVREGQGVLDTPFWNEYTEIKDWLLDQIDTHIILLDSLGGAAN